MIKNITSEIPAEKTIMEIEHILANFGAKAILKEYECNYVKSISFYLEHNGQKIPFKMPMNVEKARRVISKAVNQRKLSSRFSNEPYRTEKAIKVGWRLIKDWIHAQVSLLEIEFADPLELLLPYAYNPATNKTIYELINENKEKFLLIEDKSGED